MNGPRVAFVTAAAWHGLTADDALAAAALGARGVAVEAAVWDDPALRWEAYDALVFRSCWDYHTRASAFEAWLDAVAAAGVTTWNPLPVVRRNLHKSYLVSLAGAGLPVVPTLLLPRGTPARLAEIEQRLGSPSLVVKPAIGASAHGARVLRGPGRLGAPAARDEQAWLAERLAAEDLLVQPFVEAVLSAGEWSLVFFAGRFSHAVRKTAAAGDFRVQEEWGGRSRLETPPTAVCEAAARIVAAAAAGTLYARADLVEVDGRALLMELELIEPALFFGLATGSAERFAEALVERL